MYNFNAHTLNGLPVNYSNIPNFALDTIETDSRLNANAKLVYIRLLRYASLIKSTQFKITASWLSDNLSLDRNTVSRALKSLREVGYVNDKGIVLATGKAVDTPVTLVNDSAMKGANTAKDNTVKDDDADTVSTGKEVAKNAINDLMKLFGVGKKYDVETVKKEEPETVEDVQNAALNAVDYSIDHVQNAASNAVNYSIECSSFQHLIKNKEENKEKNTGDCAKIETSSDAVDRLENTQDCLETESTTNLITVTKTNGNGLGKITINPNIQR